MNKLVGIGVIALLAIWAVGFYNTLVNLDEGTNTAWSNVETQYQRRMDLIPNLVNTVKGYATHEKETLEGVIKARAEATQIKLSIDDLSEENLAKLQAAQNSLSGALSRLMAVAENYPDLKASEQFKELQAQLEGTENRIAEARRVYNETAKNYNTKIRQFPGNILANIFGFNAHAYFKADEAASKAPSVQF